MHAMLKQYLPVFFDTRMLEPDSVWIKVRLGILMVILMDERVTVLGSSLVHRKETI